MEIEVLEKGKNKLKIKLKGETHTLCNSLRRELLNDKDVKVAGYAVEHSLLGDPFLIVEGKTPKQALLKAINKLKKRNKEFKTKLKSLK